MASTSPYQNNDYQAVSTYRPYQLPVNDIIRSITANNQFWDDGARLVKGQFDNALDLKLSLAPNREIRDQYLQEAEKKLTKLSSMNLADPTVQRQGIALFKPLFNDEGIMSDDMATRHIEKVNGDAMNYRNTDGGKYYSAVNHQYALSGAAEFKSSQDRLAGKKYLQNSKEYEQFYDPTAEFGSILKNCHPSKAAKDTPQGFYMNTYSDESLTAAKINVCMSAGLSDKAKRQIQINGAVTYRNNPEALASGYLPHLQGTRSQLSQEKAAMEGVLANKDNLKNLKKEDLQKLGFADASQITPDVLKRMEENVRSQDDRILNLNETINKIQSGDFSPMMGQNFEAIAGTVYSRDYIHNIGNGYSYDWTTNTKKGDTIQQMFYTQNQMNARQEDQQDFEREQSATKFKYDLRLKRIDKGYIDLRGGDADLLGDARLQNATNSPFAEIDKADSYEQIDVKREELVKKTDDLKDWFANQLKTYYQMPNYAPGSAEEKAWVDNFKLTSKNDPEKKKLIQQYDMQLVDYNAKHTILKGVQDKVDGQIAPIEQDLAKTVSSLPGVKLADGTVLTAADAYNAVTGKASSLRIIRGNPGVSVGGGSTGGAGTGNLSGYIPDEYYLNGKKVNTTYGEDGNKVLQLIQQIKGKQGQTLQQIKQKRNELMSRETVLQHESYNLPALNDDASQFKLGLAQWARIPKNYVSNLTVGDFDGTGRVIVTVAPPKKNETDYDQKAILDRLRTYNGGNNQVIGADGKPYANGTSVVLSGITNLTLIDDSRLSHWLEPYVRTLEGQVNARRPASTDYIPSSNGGEYRLDISTSISGGHTYRIIDKDKPQAPVASFTDRASALQSFETLLHISLQKK